MTQSEQVKACCAAAYSSDLVGLLLGESYHPGGLALTRRLAGALQLRPGQRVLDLAAGRGTSALLLAQEYGAEVVGVDLSTDNVAAATDTAAAVGLSDRVRFHSGDAEQLSFADASFDAVVCECAFCTFPDKPAAAAELARVLRPGGRVGIADVVADRDRLPDRLTSLGAWVSCIAGARAVADYAATLTDAGLRVRQTERRDDAVVAMVEQIRARIDVLAMTARKRAEAAGLDFDQAGPVLCAAATAASEGAIGYVMIVADKPRRR